METRNAPVGEWYMEFDLRNMLEPGKVHDAEEVRAVCLTSALMREKRKEPYFPANATFIQASGCMCRVKGVSPFDLETSILILDELAFCLGACCGQNFVDIFIPSQDQDQGQRIYRRRYKIRRS